MHRAVYAVVTLGIATALLANPAPALPTGPLFITLDAADRARDAGPCAPDGEAMRDTGVPNIGGGTGIEYPHRGCWAEWEVHLDADVPLLVLVSGTPTGGFSQVMECVQWTVHIDDVLHGKSPPHCGDRGLGFLTPLPVLADPLELVIPPSIPAGTHTIRVTSQIVVGPSWANAYIQHLILGPNLPPLPIPDLPPIIECIAGGGPVVLDGTPSVDLDGDALAIDWDAPIEGLESVGEGLSAGSFPLGITLAELSAADAYFAATRPVRVDVRDTLAPEVVITRPLAGHLYVLDDDLGPAPVAGSKVVAAGPLTLQAVAEDLCDLASVRFRAPGLDVTLTEPPFTTVLQPPGPLPAEFVLIVEARDHVGKITQSTITITQSP